MSRRKYFLSIVPSGRAIRSSVGFQILLAGLLLYAASAAQAQSAFPSGNDSKVPSGTAASREPAVLLDEDPADRKGKKYSGYVVWRIETIQEAAEKPDVAIRADIDIPERNLKMAISLRRNTDQVPLMRHTLEVTLGGVVGKVLGVTMRRSEDEEARSVPLAGAALNVGEGFFWVGVSNSDAVQARNLRLANEVSWFDIPIVYKNNLRAILSIEKGASGREIFEKAFTAWKVQKPVKVPPAGCVSSEVSTDCEG
jgi:hypothetical protein